MYDILQNLFSLHEFFYLHCAGGATSTLRILFKGAPFFTGCMEDVVLDDEVLIPRTVPQPMRVYIIRKSSNLFLLWILIIFIIVFAYSLHKEVSYGIPRPVLLLIFKIFIGPSPRWLSSCWAVCPQPLHEWRPMSWLVDQVWVYLPEALPWRYLSAKWVLFFGWFLKKWYKSCLFFSVCLSVYLLFPCLLQEYKGKEILTSLYFSGLYSPPNENCIMNANHLVILWLLNKYSYLVFLGTHQGYYYFQNVQYFMICIFSYVLLLHNFFILNFVFGADLEVEIST